MSTAIFRPSDRPLLHLGLFGTTLVTTTASFFTLFAKGPTALAELGQSLLFGSSLVLILGAHEMGHYLLARYHGVDTTLPYFIPVPPPLGLGTLGAVIRIRGRIPTRNALVDIGAAGPLAGLLVAVPVLMYGLAHSEVVPYGGMRPRSLPGEWSAWTVIPKMLDYLWARVHSLPVPAPSGRPTMFFGDNLLMMALQRLVKGPLPPGTDVEAHPMVLAGWFGLLVTMLNLMPIGQLDGGHLTFALFGRRAEAIGKVVAAALVFLVVFCSIGWVVWLAVTVLLVRFQHPDVLHVDEPLTFGRKVVCAISAVALILCVMPVPISQVYVP